MNAKQIYERALREKDPRKIAQLQDVIVASANAEYIYWFACDVKGADRG